MESRAVRFVVFALAFMILGGFLSRFLPGLGVPIGPVPVGPVGTPPRPVDPDDR